MKNSERGMCVLLMAACLVVGIIVGAVATASGQTSTVTDVTMLQDEGAYTGEVLISFEASCPGEWVGIYYRIEDVTDGWLYCWHDPVEVVWAPPVWDRVYQFASHVTCDGVDETYPHDRPEPQHEYEIFLTMEPAPSDSCDLTVLEHIAALAEKGFDLEADTPAVGWWWFHAHPDSGNAAALFQVEWEVDGVSAFVDSVSVQADSTWSFWNAPYTVGQTQRLRVRGKDAFGAVGQFSEWSDPFTDRGPPGTPQTPLGTLIMID